METSGRNIEAVRCPTASFVEICASQHLHACTVRLRAANFWGSRMHFSSFLHTTKSLLVTLCLQTDRAEELGATFALEHEDHTLVNALRFFLNKKCAAPGKALLYQRVTQFTVCRSPTGRHC